MKLDPLKIAQAMKDYGEIKKLIDALRSNPDGQETRWKLLQDWLDDNPKYRKILEQSLKLTPSNALDYLITEMGFEPQMLATMFDRDGELRKKLESGIALIQELYKERAKQ